MIFGIRTLEAFDQNSPGMRHDIKLSLYQLGPNDLSDSMNFNSILYSLRMKVLSDFVKTKQFSESTDT